jgi:hypothetical protein
MTAVPHRVELAQCSTCHLLLWRSTAGKGCQKSTHYMLQAVNGLSVCVCRWRQRVQAGLHGAVGMPGAVTAVLQADGDLR